MEPQLCSAKNKTAKYENADAIWRIPMDFLATNSPETPRHAIAPPGSTLGPGSTLRKRKYLKQVKMCLATFRRRFGELELIKTTISQYTNVFQQILSRMQPSSLYFARVQIAISMNFRVMCEPTWRARVRRGDTNCFA